MRVYFDDDGTLVVAAENNTEMMALTAWDAAQGPFLVMPKEHKEYAESKFLEGNKIKC